MKNLCAVLVFMLFLTCAAFACAAQAENDLKIPILKQPVVLTRTIPTDRTTVEEAFAFSVGCSVPICVEVLHGNFCSEIPRLRTAVPAGVYTIQSALDNLKSQGVLVNYQILSGAVFVTISAASDIDDPLNIKMNVSAKTAMTVQDWVDWLYKQEPVTGFLFTPPDYPQKVFCEVSKGETIRSVFAALATKTDARWFLFVNKNNHVVVHTKQPGLIQPPLSADDLRYLDQPAKGDQQGRTTVYYLTKTHAAILPGY